MAPKAPPLGKALSAISFELQRLEVPFALVGGLAVSARAEPRLTRDIDLAVGIEDDARAEELIRALAAKRYRVAATVEQVHTGRLATVRLVPPGPTQSVVDLLFASSGIEIEIVKAAESLEILPGVVVPVARTGHLIAMKLLSRDDRGRPQDFDDIVALLEVSTARDRRLVETALRQIAARGFARGRNLPARWRAVSRRVSSRRQ